VVPGHQFDEGAKGRMRTQLANLEKELGRKPTFADFIEKQITVLGLEATEERLNSYEALYEQTTGEKPADVWDDFFSLEALTARDVDMGMLDTEDPNRRLGQPAKKKPNPAAKPIPPPVRKPVEKDHERSEDNENPDRDTNRHSPNRATSDPRPKLAHRHQKIVEDENGKLHVIAREFEPIHPDNLVQNRYILDYAYMNQVREDSEKDPNALTIRQADVDSVPFSDGKTWGEKKAEAKEAYGEGTEAYNAWFVQMVPVVAVHAKDGTETNISMIHDKTWYRVEVFEDTTGKDKAQAIEDLDALRRELAENGGPLPIKLDDYIWQEGSAWGQEHKLPEGAEPIALSEATGETTLAFINGEGEVLLNKVGKSGKAFTGRLVNDETEIKALAGKGTIVEIRRVSQNRDGSWNYRAHRVFMDSAVSKHENLRRPLNTMIHATVQEAVMAAYVLNNINHNPTFLKAIEDRYGMTISKARAVKDRVQAETGHNIQMNLKGFVDMFINTYQNGGLSKTLTSEHSLEGATYLGYNSDGLVEIGTKGKVRDNGNHIRYTLGGRVASTELAMKAIGEVFGEGGMLSKARLKVNVAYINQNLEVTMVDAQGNGVKKAYDDHIKDQVRTVTLSHKVEGRDGKDLWVTDVQPMVFPLLGSVPARSTARTTRRSPSPSPARWWTRRWRRMRRGKR